MFRRYSCDCIGFEVTDDDGDPHAYCVWACDAPVEAPSFGMWDRPGLLEKTSEPVSFDRTVSLLDQISKSIKDADRYHTIRIALGIR